jgi:ribosomal protein S12 methylthiotransferase accessory factor
LWRTLAAGTARPARTSLPAPVVDVVAALVGDECVSLSRSRPGRTRNGVIAVNVLSLAVRPHPLLPDPLCPVCGQIPDDSPDAGTFELRARPKQGPDGYRLRDLVAERDQFLSTYVDPRCGVVPAVIASDANPLMTAAAIACPPGQPSIDGYGRTVSHGPSAVVAVAEALERMGGLRPRDRRISVRASFVELGPDRAVEPESLGLPVHPPDGSGGYRPDLALDWAYGYSFRRRGPVLVPAEVAYYGHHSHPRITVESSNGCALGGCLEEAILYGILELAERDAFLTMWYARLPLTRVDPGTSADPVTRMLLARVERETGCRAYAFDATMPEGVPSLFLLLVDELDRPGIPKVSTAAGAHLDPERALRGGLVELGGSHRYLTDMIQRDRQRAEALAADPDLVVELEDHALVYATAASWPRLDFLFQRDDVRSVAEAFPVADRYVPADDLLVDLRHLVGRYLDAGLDVVVVEQTTTEHRAADLRCVKVIIPGTLPMSFGHRNRRTDLPRLRTAPVRLGYRATPLPEHDINPDPHPFY